MKIIDLSVPLANDKSWAPRRARSRVEHQSHKMGRIVMRWIFGVKQKHLHTGLGWATDTISLSTHGTTHVDAPWHYGPLCEGKPARTIDQMPLDWFYGPGVVLDIRNVDRRSAASLKDVQQALEKIEHTLSPREIVLMQTDNDRLLGSREYFWTGPGVSAEATHWLIDQGVKLTGIDSWGWDAPLIHQAQQAKQTGRRDIFWSAHYVGTEKEYCHMERLANLDQLPSSGFMVCAFPLKVKGGSAGPSRVVALIEENTELRTDS